MFSRTSKKTKLKRSNSNNLINQKQAIPLKKRSATPVVIPSNRPSLKQQKRENSSHNLIEDWLHTNHIWFNDKTAHSLTSTLVQSGITHPNEELHILKEWPDLIQIADTAVE